MGVEIDPMETAGNLSVAQQQLVEIAKALSQDAQLIIMDEPTAALDVETQAKLMDALGGLEHTMSVVLITHRAELLRLVDRVIEVVDGEVRSGLGDMTV